MRNYISYTQNYIYKRITACACLLLVGCAATNIKDTFDYHFCKPGIGGDYRILIPSDPNEMPVLGLFSVGGPYDKEHMLCVVSGDHSILDLGKGKQS